MLYFVSAKLLYGTYIMYTLLTIFLWTCSSDSIEEQPDNLKPVEYDLLINTNLDANLKMQDSWGHVKITVLCTSETNLIAVNKKNLDIKRKSLKVWNTVNSEDVIEVTDGYTTPKEQYLIILDKNLSADQKYVIMIAFVSISDSAGYIVNKDLSISYTEQGKYITRNIFPCFDRIDLKSEFKIQLGHQRSVKGFSNYELVSQIYDAESDWVIDEFAMPDVRMSTFSINLALSHFPCQHFSVKSSTIKIQVCLESRYLELMEYVGGKVAAVFSYISKYIPVPYPLSKFDLVVQNDIDLNIKDGFGLVVIETKYLFSIVETEPMGTINNPSIKYAGLSRLCYIISNQWFGHMVTMRWEENWFHYGLNRFIQWKCAAEEQMYNHYKNFPSHEWDIISSFLYLLKREEIGDFISIPLNNPDWASEPDAYDIELKVAHLIRMTRFIMGPEVFEKSLSDYLETFKFRNTNLFEVWNSFTMTARPTEDVKTVFVAGLDMKTVMSDWLFQKGYPLITIIRDYAENKIILRQGPFLDFLQDSDRMFLDTKELEDECWTIPLSYATASDTNYGEVKVVNWYTCTSKGVDGLNDRVLHIEGLHENHWLIVNMELNVPCRVNYDYQNWILIKKLFLFNLNYYPSINVLTRVRLISDMFTMAKAERLHYKLVFETMEYLPKEQSYAVWKVAIEELHEIRSRLLDTVMNLHVRFKNYVRTLIEPVFKRMKDTEYSFKEADPSELKLSVLIMEQACTFGVKDCIEFGSKIIKKDRAFKKSSINRIPHSINKAIHCQQVKRSDSHWNRLWKQYLTGTYSQEVKEGILEALGCSRNHDYLTRYLKSSLTTKKVSNEDRVLIFKSLSTNVKGYSKMKKFLMNRYDDLEKLQTTSTGMIPYWQIIFDATSYLEDWTENKHDLTFEDCNEIMKIEDEIKFATVNLNIVELKEFAKSRKINMEDKNIKRSISNGMRNYTWMKYWVNKLDKLLGFKYQYNLF